MKIAYSPDNFDRALAEKQKTEKDLLKLKEFKISFAKDIQRLTRFLGDSEEADKTVYYFLKTNHEFLDKAGQDIPTLILGKPSAEWMQFIKAKLKTEKNFCSYGTCKIEQVDGKSRLVLDAEQGNAKRKLAKKLVEKFLLPDGMELVFTGKDDESELDAPDTEQPVEQPTEGDPLLGIVKDKLFAYFQAFLKEADPAKKTKLYQFLQTNITQWLGKYALLAPNQKDQAKPQHDGYQAILTKINEGDFQTIGERANDQTNLKKTHEALNQKINNAINTFSGLLGFTDKFKSSRFKDLIERLKNLQKLSDLDQKSAYLRDTVALAQTWLSEKEGTKDKTLQTRTAVVKSFLSEIAPFTPEALKTGKLEVSGDKSLHKNQGKFFTNPLYEATSGTQESNKSAVEVRDASVDDRALRLAAILHEGSNNDVTFGAVIKWAADSMYKDLESKYVTAVKEKYKKNSTLFIDVVKLFGADSLRTRYIFDALAGKTSPYAPLAFKLGLLGETWKDGIASKTKGILSGGTAERSDAMEEIVSNLGLTDIDTILAATDPKTFEGAINIELEKRFEKIFKQIEARREMLQTQEAATKSPNDDAAKQKYYQACDAYLCRLVKRVRNEGSLFGSRINPSQLNEEILAWAKTTPQDVRDYVLEPNTQFSELLRELKGTFKISGIGEGDVRYLIERIKAKRDVPADQQDILRLDEVKAMAAKQQTKWGITRWWENKDAGEEFKAVLFGKDGLKNPQLAVVQQYGNSADIKRWGELNQQVAQARQTGDNGALAQLQKERQEIFDRAYTNVQLMLEKADIHADLQKQISETIRSNGSKAEAYQKLTELAKTWKIKFDFGMQVLEVLESITPDSKEFAAIRNDNDMLLALKARTIGRLATKGNRKQWGLIAKILGLTGALADPYNMDGCETIGDTKENFKRAHRVSRAKLSTPDEEQQQQADAIKQKGKLDYWAARLVAEYKKGLFSREPHRLIQTCFDAQKQGLSLKAIFEEVQKLSNSAYDYVMNDGGIFKILKEKLGANVKVLREAITKDAKLSIADVLEHSSKFFKTSVSDKEINALLESLTPKDILEQCFDFAAFRVLINTKKDKVAATEQPNLDAEALEKLKSEIADLNKQIKQLDISNNFQALLEKVLKSQKALAFKKKLRSDVGNALLDTKDNEVKQAFLQLGFTAADLRLIALDIQAISNIETEKGLETGLQWSSQSSRMLQRDLATAKYLKQGWEKNERVEAIGQGFASDELEEEKMQMAAAIQQLEGVMQQAQANFKERRDEYNAIFKKIIEYLLMAVVMAVGLGVSAATNGAGLAVVLPIMISWGIGSAVFKKAVNSWIATAVEGDGAGTAGEKAFYIFKQSVAELAVSAITVTVSQLGGAFLSNTAILAQIANAISENPATKGLDKLLETVSGGALQNMLLPEKVKSYITSGLKLGISQLVGLLANPALRPEDELATKPTTSLDKVSENARKLMESASLYQVVTALQKELSSELPEVSKLSALLSPSDKEAYDKVVNGIKTLIKTHGSFPIKLDKQEITLETLEVLDGETIAEAWQHMDWANPLELATYLQTELGLSNEKWRVIQDKARCQEPAQLAKHMAHYRDVLQNALWDEILNQNKFIQAYASGALWQPQQVDLTFDGVADEHAPTITIDRNQPIKDIYEQWLALNPNEA